MINKESLKKVIITGLILILISSLTIFVVLTIQYKNYEKIVNLTVSNLIDEIMENYPETDEQELIRIINSENQEQKDEVLSKYGYTNNISYIKELENSMNTSIRINIAIIILLGLIAIIVALIYTNKRDKSLRSINKYLDKVNNGNYELKIEDNGEDEISRLRNELYKTTILLRESAENSEKEKTNLSNSLADISHQLKTPLTSIRIMLDNIEENPNMDEKTRNEFIEEISRQIDWISSLVVSLLKLAKFDAGSIVMQDKDINVKKLIDNVINNLAIMIDIKNIKIDEKIDEDVILRADYNWQLEALTNIIKNCIEHSKEDSSIKIEVENNSIFVKIKITDEGEGIAKEDISHIFERFYKSKQVSENSIGIGLSLAKTIIEKENGYIKVDSELGKGTTFEIKYLK